MSAACLSVRLEHHTTHFPMINPGGTSCKMDMESNLSPGLTRALWNNLLILTWTGLFLCWKNYTAFWEAGATLETFSSKKSVVCCCCCSVRLLNWDKDSIVFSSYPSCFVSRRWTCWRKRWSTSCLWRLVPYWLYQDGCRVNKKRLRPSEGWEEEGSGKNGQKRLRSETGRGDPVSFLTFLSDEEWIEGTPLPFFFLLFFYSKGDLLKTPTCTRIWKRHLLQLTKGTFERC